MEEISLIFFFSLEKNPFSEKLKKDKEFFYNKKDSELVKQSKRI
jgi:hypothetical protein